MPAYFLTQEDHDTLQELIAAWRGGRINIPSRTPILPFTPGLSPECYIALPQDAQGIPAIYRYGTGSGTPFNDTDIPGHGLCDIYQIIDNTSPDIDLVYTGNSVIVWNLTDTIIPQDWITIVRDKFGMWLPVVGGGGGCESQSAGISVTIFGNPSGGYFRLAWNINGVQEDIDHVYNGTAATFATELATHSQVAPADIFVSGGTFPNATRSVLFQGALANLEIDPPEADWSDNLPGTGTGAGSGLTGGVGIGVVCALFRKGHA